MALILLNAKKEFNMQLKLQVFQIDAWADGESEWRYNNVIPLGKVYITGEPTKTKLLNALRRNHYLPDVKDNENYYLDDYFSSDGTWCIQQADDYMPLFDFQEFR